MIEIETKLVLILGKEEEFIGNIKAKLGDFCKTASAYDKETIAEVFKNETVDLVLFILAASREFGITDKQDSG